jgi:hypothetical protein
MVQFTICDFFNLWTYFLNVHPQFHYIPAFLPIDKKELLNYVFQLLH